MLGLWIVRGVTFGFSIGLRFERHLPSHHTYFYFHQRSWSSQIQAERLQIYEVLFQSSFWFLLVIADIRWKIITKLKILLTKPRFYVNL